MLQGLGPRSSLPDWLTQVGPLIYGILGGLNVDSQSGVRQLLRGKVGISTTDKFDQYICKNYWPASHVVFPEPDWSGEPGTKADMWTGVATTIAWVGKTRRAVIWDGTWALGLSDDGFSKLPGPGIQRDGMRGGPGKNADGSMSEGGASRGVYHETSDLGRWMDCRGKTRTKFVETERRDGCRLPTRSWRATPRDRSGVCFIYYSNWTGAWETVRAGKVHLPMETYTAFPTFPRILQHFLGKKTTGVSL